MAPTGTSATATTAGSGIFSFRGWSLLSFDTSNGAEEEDSGRTDLEGLVEFLAKLRNQNIRLQEITYVINRWTLGGVIPMTHHGFILKTSNDGYFTLDFSRKGIVWEVMDELPELPDDTFYTKRYTIDMDTSAIQKYCEETPPFNFPFYDCETWAKGLISTLALEKVAQEVYETREASADTPKKMSSPARKQRTG